MTARYRKLNQMAGTAFLCDEMASRTWNQIRRAWSYAPSWIFRRFASASSHRIKLDCSTPSMLHARVCCCCCCYLFVSENVRKVIVSVRASFDPPTADGNDKCGIDGGPKWRPKLNEKIRAARPLFPQPHIRSEGVETRSTGDDNRWPVDSELAAFACQPPDGWPASK